MWMKVFSVVLVCAMALPTQEAWAKRLGGGASVGKQSANVAPRNAAPANPQQAPTSGTATGTAPGAPSAAPAASAAAAGTAAAGAAARKPWGAMLGGLAAGLGLAWLASSLGLGEAFANVLLVLLLGALLLAVAGWWLRSRGRARVGGPAYAYAADGATSPPSYSPKNVGNDASARPWEHSSLRADGGSAFAGSGSLIGSAIGGGAQWGVPADFDVAGFLQASKTNFVNLQAAWDRADIPSLRAMMTDDMLEQIKAQLAEREQHTGGGPNRTEVVMLEAHLLGIEELADAYMASVEFSGLIREDVDNGPNPFREVWNITRPKGGASGWLVAGVQALQ